MKLKRVSKYMYWLLLCIAIGAFCSVWLGRQLDFFGFTFYPTSNNNYIYRNFVDARDGGSSKFITYKDSKDSLYIHYLAGAKRKDPYVGISARPKKKEFFDIYCLAQVLKLELTHSKAAKLPIQVIEEIPNYTDHTKPLSYRYHIFELPVKVGKHQYEVALEDFEEASWWKENNPLSHNLPDFDPSNIAYIGLRNPLKQAVEGQDYEAKLTVHSLALSSNYKLYLICLFLAIELSIFFFFFLLGAFQFWSIYRKGKFFLNAKIVKEDIVEPSVEVEEEQTPEDWVDIVNFISENFHVSEMSLSYLEKKLRISEAKISLLFSEHSADNFRTYVNKKRLEKSIELLRDSKASVSEIALSVGFDYVQSFNRVFKKEYGMTPTEFRKNL